MHLYAYIWLHYTWVRTELYEANTAFYGVPVSVLKPNAPLVVLAQNFHFTSNITLTLNCTINVFIDFFTLVGSTR